MDGWMDGWRNSFSPLREITFGLDCPTSIKNLLTWKKKLILKAKALDGPE